MNNVSMTFSNEGQKMHTIALQKKMFNHEQLGNFIASTLKDKFSIHPFSRYMRPDNVMQVLRQYLAMSQAFPYLQAGSQKELIFECMEQNTSIPLDVEITSVVGNFLTWDETGGHSVTMRKGNEGLPDILNTWNFHANLLRDDIKSILGEDIEPDYSPATTAYLKTLYEGLANRDAVTRCAAMVAFEYHAERMIESLWTSLSDLYPDQKETLKYFHTHVGGDDPAEAYHVAMTSRMLELLVPSDKSDTFLREFEHFYAVNVNWCESITINSESH